jgi:hypothetical protein
MVANGLIGFQKICLSLTKRRSCPTRDKVYYNITISKNARPFTNFDRLLL